MKIIIHKKNRLFLYALTIFLLLFIIKFFFKYIYFPIFPKNYYETQIISGYEPGKDNIDLVPVGGCFNTCWGKTTKISCNPSAFSKNFEDCKLACYGYLYNNCSSTNFEILIYKLLTI